MVLWVKRHILERKKKSKTTKSGTREKIKKKSKTTNSGTREKIKKKSKTTIKATLLYKIVEFPTYNSYKAVFFHCWK